MIEGESTFIEKIRLDCLIQAITLFQDTAVTAEFIVEVAELFEAYIKGYK